MRDEQREQLDDHDFLSLLRQKFMRFGSLNYNAVSGTLSLAIAHSRRRWTCRSTSDRCSRAA